MNTLKQDRYIAEGMMEFKCSFINETGPSLQCARGRLISSRLGRDSGAGVAAPLLSLVAKACAGNASGSLLRKSPFAVDKRAKEGQAIARIPIAPFA